MKIGGDMGKKSGSGAVIAGTVGTVIGAGIGFAVGGPPGAVVGAQIGAGIGGTGGAVAGAKSEAGHEARKAQAEMTNALNALEAGRRDKKPEIPTQDSRAIQNARNMKALQLSQRSGRESTFLTNKFGG